MIDGEKDRDMRKDGNMQEYFVQRKMGGKKKKYSRRSKMQLSKWCCTMAGLEYRWSLTWL